jgi:DNA-binding PadR family transcriptional regulator
MTPAELAVLSLVAETPRHGYEIEQVIEARGMRSWTEIGFSSIYYLLGKLQKRELVERRILPAEGRGPQRNVFHITTEGRQVFRQSVIEALAQPQRFSMPLLLGLGNLPAVSSQEGQAALSTHQHALSDQLDLLKTSRENQEPLPYFVAAMFDLSETLMETQIDWLGQFIQILETQNVKN